MALFKYECDEVKRIIDEVSPNYPQLTTYEKEWLYFHKNGYIPGIPVELEYETVNVNPTGMVSNAIPFDYKSAILKGNSIKNYKNNLFDNVLEKGMISTSTGESNVSNSKSYRSVNFIPINGNFKIAKYGIDGDLHVCFYDSNKSFISCKTYVLKKVSEGIAIVKPPINSSYIKFYNPYDNNEPTDVFGFCVMAENESIEFEVQFVKMPVLTTTRRNLLCVGRGCDNSVTINGVTITTDVVNQTITFDGTATGNSFTQSIDSLFTQKIKKGERYALSCYLVNGTADRVIFRTNISDWSNIMTCEVNTPQYRTFSKDINYDACSFRIDKGATFNHAVFKVMFERIDVDSNTTSYEPYQSNILTVNEEVTLRGIGDVKDELNLLTGELTQRVTEIVLDGSQDLQVSASNTNTMLIIINNVNTQLTTYDVCICDKLPYVANSSEDYEHMRMNTSGKICLWIYKEKLNTHDVTGVRNYLTQNPITVYYRLVTESVKTVDLTTLTKPYEGTNNYQLSSNIPCEAILEVPVVSTGKQTLKEINS